LHEALSLRISVSGLLLPLLHAVPARELSEPERLIQNFKGRAAEMLMRLSCFRGSAGPLAIPLTG